MAVRVTLPANDEEESLVEITPLMVRNSRVHFRPRPLRTGEINPVARHMPKSAPCTWQEDAKLYACRF